MGYYNELSLDNAHRTSDDDYYDRLDGAPYAPSYTAAPLPTQTASKHIQYSRNTRDFEATLDGRLVGNYPTYREAEVALDALVFELLSKQPVTLARVAAPAEAQEVLLPFAIDEAELADAEAAAIQHAGRDYQRIDKIGKAVRYLRDAGAVAVNHQYEATIDGETASYQSDGVRCTCKCHHAKHCCYVREAARLVLAMRAARAAAGTDYRYVWHGLRGGPATTPGVSIRWKGVMPKAEKKTRAYAGVQDLFA